MKYNMEEKFENISSTDKIGNIALEEIYPVACDIFETLEKNKIFGNGHAMAQKYALLIKAIIMKRSLLKDVDIKKFEEIKIELQNFLGWIWN